MQARKVRLAGSYVADSLARRLKAYCAATGQAESAVVACALEQHLSGLNEVAAILQKLALVDTTLQRVRTVVEVCGEAFLVWVTMPAVKNTSYEHAPSTCAMTARCAATYLERLAAHLASHRRFVDDLIQRSGPRSILGPSSRAGTAG
jgi:hypothetical protein